MTAEPSNDYRARGHALAALPIDPETDTEVSVDAGGARFAAVRPEDCGLDWHLVRSATRHEARAEASLVSAGFAIYLPRRIGERRVERKRRRVERALFPGYLFVGLDPRDQAIMEVEKAEAVHAIVRFGRLVDPPPLRFKIIHQILAAEIAGEFDHAAAARQRDPEPETPVDLIGGKFRGFPAKFSRRREDERIEVLFRMLGRWTPLVVEDDEVSLHPREPDPHGNS